MCSTRRAGDQREQLTKQGQSEQCAVGCRRQDRFGDAGRAACRTTCASPTDIPAEEGVVVVVEVLNNKSTYNTLELTSGRMAKVSKGDIVVGALGHRKALFGYSGHVPPRS